MTSRPLVSVDASDEELVRRFQETRDPDCFSELFTRYRKKVYFACRAFHENGDAAEDATQETFLRVYERIHQFYEGNFSAWLMKIAKNICIDGWRKKRAQGEGAESDLEDNVIVDSSQIGASDLRLSVEQVWQEMKLLPKEQRLCLEMKIQGYSYEETAQRMGLTIEAVKSHLQNGRRKLWLKLEGEPIRLKQSKL